MPYVNIRILDEGITAEQKADLIRGVTEVISAVLKKDPEVTNVAIDEIPLDNWGIGGKSVRERRRRS